MSYWNNPIRAYQAYEDAKGWQQMQHRDQHCVCYAENMPMTQIQRVLTLEQTCARVNDLLSQGQLFCSPQHSNEVANLVRINLFYHSLRSRGNVKPMLLHYQGTRPMEAATGGTRMAALELMPEVTDVPCFVSTHVRYLPELSDLKIVRDWTEFSRLSSAQTGDQIILRLTDPAADYGLDWYEVSLSDPAMTVPQDPECLQALQHYLAQQPPAFRFEPQWFRESIIWQFQ